LHKALLTPVLLVVACVFAGLYGVLHNQTSVPFGLRIPSTRGFVVSTIEALGVVALTALAFGLCALLVAFLTVSPEEAAQAVRYGNEMVDDVPFMRAGAIHNFSYLGGLAGIVSGRAFLVRERRRALAASTP
jgi:hypothetical protein